jgi:E3 ubiquitin-protein ligase listerin
MFMSKVLISLQINIYPRTSIDNARRVRQLAHSLQGFLTLSSGKRIAPQLPKVIGAWLTGAFDSDRSVSRAALESFETAFPSEEKRKAVWKIYQGPLLEYVEDAVLRHSPQTLSDERNTSPDDAEAKYVRVVSTALLALDQLLQTDLGEKALGSNETFQGIINAKKISDLASHQDPSIRKSIYKLFTDVVNQGIQLNWKQLSSCFLAKSLHISQLGSSVQYIYTLLAITRVHPSVWTTEYASKTTASRRLCQYLKQGSQRGPEAWWTHVRQLIKSIPTQVWSADITGANEELSYDSASQLLNSLHEGVVSSDEPRQNSVAAWRTYADIFFWTSGMLHENEEQEKLVQAFLYPIVERYLLASSELSQWAVPLSISLALSSSSIRKLELIYPPNRIAAFYQSQVEGLIETMKLSQPESSKNFKASQNDLIQKIYRFMDLQIAVETTKTPTDDTEGADLETQKSELSSTFIRTNIELLREAVKLLHDRNGKPYGVAGLICIILDKRPSIIDEIGRSPTPHLLSEFLDDEAPKLLDSPSAESLISMLLKCRHMAGFEKSFGTFLDHFLRNKTFRNSRAYSTLLRGITNDDLLQHSNLRQQLLQDLDAALDGDDDLWNIIYDILTNENLNQPSKSNSSPIQSIQSHVLGDMLSGLALEEKEDHALKGFDILLNRNPTLRPLLASHLNLGSLLTRLLLISDSPDEDKADKAARLASLVKRVFAKQGEIGGGASAIEIVSRQLDGDGEALSILSLVNIAREALQDADEDSAPHVASALCPTAAHWQKALTPFLQLQPSPSVSVITRLQGCAFAIDRQRRRSSGGLPRDSEGFSVALRLTILVTKLLEKVTANRLPDEQLQALYLYYPQALQLANDKLGIETANALWIESTEEVVQEVADTVADGQRLIHSWLVDETSSDSNGDRPRLVACWLSELSNIQGTSAQAFNLARTFTTIMTEASDLRGSSRYISLWDSSLRAVRSSPDIMRSAALLAVCRETLATSALGKRLCNELVADATEVDLDDPIDGMCFLSQGGLQIADTTTSPA